jgi:L-amino acid N-acyltransferase YncA
MIDGEAYISWMLDSAPTGAKDVLGEDALARSMEEEFQRVVRTRTNPDWASQYRHHCPVSAASSEDYYLRELQLDEGTTLLGGIHFCGGDVTKPFVGVYAQTRNLTFPEMAEATRSLCDEFSMFDPQVAWWWVPGECAVDEADAFRDQRLLLGSIEDLVAKPRVGASVPFTLTQDKTGASYDAYVQVFSDFVAKNPAWKGRLQQTALDDYRECADAGALYVVERERRVVGVLAARPGVIRGVPGWEVVEQILAEELRGQGLAPIIQRSFLEKLPASDRRLVIGTIDAANHASLRTALRVGRTDAGGWYFVRDRRRPTTRWSWRLLQ